MNEKEDRKKIKNIFYKNNSIPYLTKILTSKNQFSRGDKLVLRKYTICINYRPFIDHAIKKLKEIGVLDEKGKFLEYNENHKRIIKEIQKRNI